ncbi:hypothetical protein Tco_0291846 [Tanacetum coccineum]
MGTPTQVCVWSCPNFSAPAGRPFSFLYFVSCVMIDHYVAFPNFRHCRGVTTIYEMMKGSSVWSVREGEKDAFVVINLSGKIVKYNLISKTNNEIFDIGSNQTDDDDDDVEFIPSFSVDPNLYEFIPSLASV